MVALSGTYTNFLHHYPFVIYSSVLVILQNRENRVGIEKYFNALIKILLEFHVIKGFISSVMIFLLSNNFAQDLEIYIFNFGQK